MALEWHEEDEDNEIANSVDCNLERGKKRETGKTLWTKEEAGLECLDGSSHKAEKCLNDRLRPTTPYMYCNAITVTVYVTFSSQIPLDL